MNRSKLLALAVCAAFAQPGPINDPARAPVALQAPVQDKNFYLLSLLERTPAMARALQADSALARMASEKRDALGKAAESCAASLACYASALKFSESEIAEVTAALQRLNTQGSLPGRPLRESGLFIRYQSLPDGELLARSWADAARGLNGIIDVYGLGMAPRYPAIDSVSYDVKSDGYGRLVHLLAGTLAEEKANLALFFQPALRFSLGLLDINHRDEAGRFEPLETGENRVAIARVRTMDWAKFPYSVIVVPGSGSDREAFSLSAWGKLRLTLAVKRYREGKAPFILVSGGFVHPNQTAHCEAIEMKRSLMADFGIPEEVILVDPHARHTTTNLRNAARQLYRYGLPFAKSALVTTDSDQSGYIEGAAFKDRCFKDLGYQPALNFQRKSAFDLTFMPNIESLQADALDPLDP